MPSVKDTVLGVSKKVAEILKFDSPDGYAGTIISPGPEESWRDRILREEAEEGWRPTDGNYDREFRRRRLT